MKELDVVVTEKNESCGGVVYWTLSGEVTRSTLLMAWLAEGLDAAHLPPVAAPETALRAAMETLRDRRHIVRRLPDGSGYALVAEHDLDEKTAEYKQSIRAFLSTDGSIVVEPQSHPNAEKLLDAYDTALSIVSANAISALLIGTCRRLNAVSLRTMGGIYFVPATRMAQLEQVVRALEACSGNRVWRLPAMRSEDAARAILAAVTEEIAGAVSKLEDELAIEGDAALGQRALDNRVAGLSGLREKVDEYEKLMGGSLGAVRERLERAQVALASAALLAAAEQEAA